MPRETADKLSRVKQHAVPRISCLLLLVTVAMEIFNEHMPQPNQLSFVPECSVTAQDLLRTPVKGEIT